MLGTRDKVKIIEKSPEEMAEIREKVSSSEFDTEELEVVLAGLDLITWLPKLLLEQKVTVVFELSRLGHLLVHWTIGGEVS